LAIGIVQHDRDTADQLDRVERVLAELGESPVSQRRRQRQDLQILDDVRNAQLGCIAHQPKPVLGVGFRELRGRADEMIGEECRAGDDGKCGRNGKQQQVGGDRPTAARASAPEYPSTPQHGLQTISLPPAAAK
jgi:hypothetical protein